MSGFSAAQMIISAMITPALLILASGSLIATALARLARVVDRIRKLAELAPSVAELRRHERRALLAEQAVRIFFAAVLCFVLAGFSIALDHATGDRMVWLPVGMTVAGMALIVFGSAAMLAECQLATRQIKEEIARFACSPQRGAS
jgi:apolipoprotein N-acyltransferase